MISDKRLEAALRFLAETDEESAEARTDVARTEYQVDLARKSRFLTADGSIEARKAMAEIDPHVQEVIGKHLDAMLKSEKLKAKRMTNDLVIQVWRSLNSARTKGVIS